MFPKQCLHVRASYAHSIKWPSWHAIWQAPWPSDGPRVSKLHCQATQASWGERCLNQPSLLSILNCSVLPGDNSAVETLIGERAVHALMRSGGYLRCASVSFVCRLSWNLLCSRLSEVASTTCVWARVSMHRRRAACFRRALFFSDRLGS